jgi:site-specific recombinase XerC
MNVRSRAVGVRADVLAARNVTVLERFLASRTNDASRQVMLEALDRVAKLSGKVAERVDWGALRERHTKAIVAMLAASDYSTSTSRLSLSALRGVFRMAVTMGRMTREEYGDATKMGKPWRERQLAQAVDAELERRRLAVPG